MEKISISYGISYIKNNTWYSNFLRHLFLSVRQFERFCVSSLAEMSITPSQFWSTQPMYSRTPWKSSRKSYGSRSYRTGAPKMMGFATRVRLPIVRRFAGGRYGSARSRILRRSKVGGELNGVDTTIVQTAVIATTNTNDNCQLLNAIVPGTGSWNRIGRKVRLRSLRLKGVMTYTNSTAATTYNLARDPLVIRIVWDKNPSGGALPTYAAIFGNTSQGGTESAYVFDGLRYDATGRFSLLRELIVEAPDIAPSDGAAQADLVAQVPLDLFIDLKNRETIFSGVSDPCTIADIYSGALYVYFRAPATSADSAWTVATGLTTARLRFVA